MPHCHIAQCRGVLSRTIDWQEQIRVHLRGAFVVCRKNFGQADAVSIEPLCGRGMIPPCRAFSVQPAGRAAVLSVISLHFLVRYTLLTSPPSTGTIMASRIIAGAGLTQRMWGCSAVNVQASAAVYKVCRVPCACAVVRRAVCRVPSWCVRAASRFCFGAHPSLETLSTPLATETQVCGLYAEAPTLLGPYWVLLVVTVVCNAQYFPPVQALGGSLHATAGQRFGKAAQHSVARAVCMLALGAGCGRHGSTPVHARVYPTQLHGAGRCRLTACVHGCKHDS